MGFPAEVPCSGRIGGLRVPFENGELRIAALNHKPVNRITGYRAADFTSEFLKRCHKLLIAGELAKTLALPIHRHGCTMHHLGIVATQEQDDARYFLGLRPLRKVGIRHCFTVRFRVDDAGKD